MEENKKQSIYELLDFKVTDIETHIGQSLTAEELHLKMENRMGTRMSTEEEGVVFLYLNYRIYDGDDGKFLFDLSTQSVIRLPEGEKEVSEGNIKDLSVIATDETIKVIYDITEHMGIAPIDLRLTSNPARTEANAMYQALGFVQRDTNVYMMKL